MLKCSSTILNAACTFRPYKSTPVLKLFCIFTGKITRGLSLRMVFSLLFQDTLLSGLARAFGDHKKTVFSCVKCLCNIAVSNPHT